MSYKLLVKKIEIESSKGKKFINSAEIKDYCEKLKMKYPLVIGYLLSNKYLVRILKEIFYIKSIEERKLNKVNIGFKEAIKKALEIKNVKKWYFGLESALKLNNLTHETFFIETIISDKIFRSKPFEIFGNKIKFIKTKKEMFKFGIIHKSIPFSDIEKTILDIIYFSKYRNLSNIEIKNKIADYLDKTKTKKLNSYLKHYPKSVKKFIQENV